MTSIDPPGILPAAAVTNVFMFPGQSSREPEMIEKIISFDPGSAATVRRASEVLSRDLAAHYSVGNRVVFARNRDVQVGVFLANHIHFSLLEQAGVSSDWSLGLSLGEYNHLVHIGALSFEDALRLVDERGSLYDEGAEGKMVSVFPIGAAALERVIDDLGVKDQVVVGLYNTPRQQVLSGECVAVDRVVARLDSFVDPMEIERIPMHAPLLAPVAERFRSVLARTALKPPRRSYVPNVQGRVIRDPTPDQIRECLAAHVCEPVRWQASVEAVAACVVSPRFVEVGPRSVLYNLFGRGWMPGRRSRTDASEGWQDHFCRLIAELRDGT
jgi:[acyl-carrier-protein] S-malonyltransferase